jgi:hypothetical protein
VKARSAINVSREFVPHPSQKARRVGHPRLFVLVSNIMAGPPVNAALKGRSSTTRVTGITSSGDGFPSGLWLVALTFHSYPGSMRFPPRVAPSA